jgi:hypothetical protein
MSYRHTLEAALESLQDIEELIKGFPENGDVPSIELDLSLQKLRNIYELLLVLKKPVDLSTVQSPVIASVPVSAPVSPAVSAPVSTSDSSPASMSASTPDSSPVSTPVTAPVSAPVPVSSSARTSMPVPEPPPVHSKPPVVEGGAQILSDRFKGRATLHETLHQNLGKDGQYHSQGKPVENLMSAIAINDRFTFIRELFNGDSPAFEQAIKVLNEASNFNDAYNFMMQNYDWDMDSEAVQLLLDIIRRKYIISRHE